MSDALELYRERIRAAQERLDAMDENVTLLLSHTVLRDQAQYGPDPAYLKERIATLTREREHAARTLGAAQLYAFHLDQADLRRQVGGNQAARSYMAQFESSATAYDRIAQFGYLACVHDVQVADNQTAEGATAMAAAAVFAAGAGIPSRPAS